MRQFTSVSDRQTDTDIVAYVRDVGLYITSRAKNCIGLFVDLRITDKIFPVTLQRPLTPKTAGARTDPVTACPSIRPKPYYNQ